MSEADSPTTEAQNTTTYAVDAELAELTEDVRELSDRLADLEAEDVEHAADGTLSELRSALKDAEKTVENTRKAPVEDEMKDRVEVGDSLGENRLVEASRRFVTDEGAAIRTLAEEGVSLHRVFEVDRKSLETVADEEGIEVEGTLGSTTYTYFSR